MLSISAVPWHREIKFIGVVDNKIGSVTVFFVKFMVKTVKEQVNI